MKRWELYVDESGELQGDSSSVVAGVLFRRPVSREALRDALDVVATGPVAKLTYPLHASWLRTPGGVLASWFEGSANERLTEVVRAMGASEAPPVRGFADALLSGREPSYESLPAAQRWLSSHDRALLGSLNAESDRFANAMRALGLLLSQEADAVTVAVDASTEGLDEGAERGGNYLDRYLSALRALLERVVLLARASDVRRVEVTVATRGIRLSGMEQRIELRVVDVGHAVRDAIGYPERDHVEGFESRGLRVVVVDVPKFDAHAHPGVVVADFVANRMRRQVEGAPSWGRLRDESARVFALPLEVTLKPGWLPLVACDGEPRRILRDGLLGAAVGERLDALPPSWRREQVARWLEVPR
ncbi:MAG: hypothetical protein H6724_10190 [Sandaracinus sp.]|nr:hypothetical protein [Sandaracinus sp.]